MRSGYYVQANSLRGGSSNRKRYRVPVGSGVTPPTSLGDALTFPGFAVGYSATVNVSGGGAALQTAINAAAPQTRLLIVDSLAYNAITIANCSDLTIEADTGQTPTIVASAGVGGHCVTLGDGNDGLALIGLTLDGNGNVNTGVLAQNGLISGDTTQTGWTSFKRFIVDRCHFTEAVKASGTAAIFLGGDNDTNFTNVVIRHCTLDSNGCGATGGAANLASITIFGFGNVFIQNTKIFRSTISRAASALRGVSVCNVSSVIEDVICWDLGTSGTGRNFIASTLSGAIPTPTATIRNCVVYNGKQPFRCEIGDLTIDHCTVYVDTGSITNAQTIFLLLGGTLTVTSCVLEGAGTGTAFSASATEDHNDIFNVAANGKVLDGTDLTIDPVLTDTANNDYRATDAQVTGGGTGGDPMGVMYPGGTEIFWAGQPI